MAVNVQDILAQEDYKQRYGFYTKADYVDFEKGLSEEVVRKISALKNEPEWMLEKRLLGYKMFLSKPTPKWGADLSKIDYNDIYYYKRLKSKEGTKWEDVPDEIKKTFDKLGVPEAERKFFAGAEAQFDSGVVYSHVNEELEKLGVIFTDTDTAVKKYPELLKKFFGTVIPPTDNKFAALNSAVWSGGSVIYVPKGVKVPMPLNAYFRINAEKSGQFERTLIIADEGADVTYIEGCFVEGTKVKTREGYKTIERIAVGESVETHKGDYRRVYHTQTRPYDGELFTIDYYGDTTQQIRVTEEHPLLAVRKRRAEYSNTEFSPSWIAAKELAKGDYLAIPIDRKVTSNEVLTFEIKRRSRWHDRIEMLNLKTDKDFFRLVGYYLSEGSILGKDGHSNYVSFTFNKGEGKYINDLVSLLEKYFGKKPLIGKEYKNGISVTLSSTSVSTFFAEQFGRGAANKKLPTWALNESAEKQRELVKGFWRGDGSFMYKLYAAGAKRMFRMNTISATLATQLRDILLRLDIFSSIHVAKRSGNRQPMYVVYVGGDNIPAFVGLIEFFSSETVVKENYSMKMLLDFAIRTHVVSYAKILGNYAFVPIKAITSERVSNLPVYNFSVEEDESYVAAGVAVHNCTAPVFSASALHAAVVELVAHKNSHIRYVTIQNWAKNVYNLVTQRADVQENAHVEWIDANIGSLVNMKYPSVYLKGKNAKGEILSIALAGEGQTQDSGGKVYHFAPNTTSRMVSKSISKGSGLTTFRGLVYIGKDAENAKVNTTCDALLMDDKAKTNTYPYVDIQRNDAMISHEAKVGKISEDEVFYLMSRGIPESDAIAMIILGFLNDLTKVLPMEYSLELKRLIKLDMAGSVG